jgi:3-hydroxyisobutyrate dehydrogenase-like beta-hydroxyacid dehydrogenase
VYFKCWRPGDRRALAECDLVFLSLPDDEVVDNFLFGAEGIA